MQGNTPGGNHNYEVKLVALQHQIERLNERLNDLHTNHTEHKKELSELSKAVSRLSNTINRAIWIIIGAASVITFLSSGQFTKTVRVGEAIVDSQQTIIRK